LQPDCNHHKGQNFGPHLLGGDGNDPEGAGCLVKDAERILTDLRHSSLTGIAPADEVGSAAGAPDHEVHPGGVLLVPEEPGAGGRLRPRGGEGVVAGGEVANHGGGRGVGGTAREGGVDGDIGGDFFDDIGGGFVGDIGGGFVGDIGGGFVGGICWGFVGDIGGGFDGGIGGGFVGGLVLLGVLLLLLLLGGGRGGGGGGAGGRG